MNSEELIEAREAAWDKFARDEGYGFTDVESNIAFDGGWDAVLTIIKAHTPTDDERRIWASLAESIVGENEGTTIPVPVEDIRALLSRRSEVPEPQGEPTDAQVRDSMNAYQEAYEADYDFEDCIHAALRAAGGAS